MNLHVITIVLDGAPWISKHLPEFEKLKSPWTWHIVHGTAANVGSTAWFNALKRDGSHVDVAAFLRNWAERAAIYQQQSRKYWLYQ